MRVLLRGYLPLVANTPFIRLTMFLINLEGNFLYYFLVIFLARYLVISSIKWILADMRLFRVHFTVYMSTVAAIVFEVAMFGYRNSGAACFY